jgi:hypothetical protein
MAIVPSPDIVDLHRLASAPIEVSMMFTQGSESRCIEYRPSRKPERTRSSCAGKFTRQALGGHWRWETGRQSCRRNLDAGPRQPETSPRINRPAAILVSVEALILSLLFEAAFCVAVIGLVITLW